MTVYGVTPTGFVIKPVSAIQASIKAKILARLGSDIDVSDAQPLGQLIGVFAEECAEVWELAEVAYNATNRGDAEGDLLDNIGGLTGTERLDQSPSVVPCSPTFTAAGTYAAASLVASVYGNAGAQFQNADDIIVPATGDDGQPIGTGHPYTAAGALWESVSDGPDLGNILLAANTLFQASVGPGAAASITLTAGVVHVTGLTGMTPGMVSGLLVLADAATGANNGSFAIASYVSPTEVTITNPHGGTDANNGSIVWSGSAYGQLNVMTPVAGWLSMADVANVTLGTLEEVDTPYRTRQEQELSSPGNNTLDACKAAILRALTNTPIPLTLPPSVQMYENTTLEGPDVNGLPGKSFLAVVFDGQNPSTQQLTQDNALIGQAIWGNKPGGMQAFGTTVAPCIDKDGNPKATYFIRATGVPIWMSMTVYVAAGTSAATQNAIGAAVAKAIIAASQGSPFTLYGTTFVPEDDTPTTLLPGDDVIASAFQAIAQGQAGVKMVDTFEMGTTSSVAAVEQLPMVIGQYAYIPQLNIDVTVAIFVP